jgi:hypothetical protein
MLSAILHSEFWPLVQTIKHRAGSQPWAEAMIMHAKSTGMIPRTDSECASEWQKISKKETGGTCSGIRKGLLKIWADYSVPVPTEHPFYIVRGEDPHTTRCNACDKPASEHWFPVDEHGQAIKKAVIAR